MPRRKLIEDRMMLNVYVSRAEKEKFDAIAQSEGVSTSHLIRMLMNRYIRDTESKN